MLGAKELAFLINLSLALAKLNQNQGGDRMKYKIIQLPFDKKIRDLTEREAKLFNEWFIKTIPDRLETLKKYIESEDKKTASQLDFSSASLVPLGQWFEKKISIREMTKKEIEKEKKSLYKFPDVEPHKWAFTEETHSLFFDVGIYFGEVFVRKFKSIHWSYVTKPKSYIYRNWPILLGFKTDM